MAEWTGNLTDNATLKCMDIGKPQREIYVEPLELPEPIREIPREMPLHEPEREPVKQEP